MGHALWKRIAAQGNTELDERQLARLDQYLDLLVAWNERINLTRIVDRADAEVRHVADALTLLRFMDAYRPTEVGRPLTLADVGTGGGVPGVPLAIARPDLRVTLIDSTKKKLDAIAAMVAEIGMTNVMTRHARIEAVDEKFDIITARAVADLDTLLDWCEPLMYGRSVLLAMKGPKAQEEMDRIDPKRAGRFRFEIVPIEDDVGLHGHVVVRITRDRS